MVVHVASALTRVEAGCAQSAPMALAQNDLKWLAAVRAVKQVQHGMVHTGLGWGPRPPSPSPFTENPRLACFLAVGKLEKSSRFASLTSTCSMSKESWRTDRCVARKKTTYLTG